MYNMQNCKLVNLLTQKNDVKNCSLSILYWYQYYLFCSLKQKFSNDWKWFKLEANISHFIPLSEVQFSRHQTIGKYFFFCFSVSTILDSV